jgi:hypothetical protein
MALSISWKRYDEAYYIWKKYKWGHIEGPQALQMIDSIYGIYLFFLLYPLYKTVKPFGRFFKSLNRILIDRPSIPTLNLSSPAFDPSRRTVLLVSHEASQTGAPVLAFNLIEKFAVRYNVISVLLGPGGLENAFRDVSSVTIGPFPINIRHTDRVHKPILDACRRFAPASVGTMFWARTDAIAPLLELDLGWNDYPAEPVPYDGTILHATERLFPVVAQHRGFEIAGTYVPGVAR